MSGGDDDENAVPGGELAWVYGVIFMAIGSILNNLGNNLMSLGHLEQRNIESLHLKRTESDLQSQASVSSKDELEKLDKEIAEVEKKGTWWLTGTIVFIIGALLAFLSFGFAAQSLLAALESIQFISNVFFHKYVHGLEITNRIIYCTVTIVVGNMFVVLFASHASIQLNARDITYVYANNTNYHVFLIVSGVFWFLAHGTYLYYQSYRQAGMKLWRHSKVEPFCFVVSATLIGTQSVLHAKNLSMLMQLCIAGDNQFASYHAGTLWGTLTGWIVTAVIYVQRINKGLSMYPCLFFIPTMTVCFCFFTIVCGGIFFDEFKGQSELANTMFGLGTFLIFAGVSQLESTEEKIVPGDSDSESMHPCAIQNETPIEPNNDKSSQQQSPGSDEREVSKLVAHNRRTTLLPNPSTTSYAMVLENRQEIREELNEVMQRGSEILQDQIARVRAGSQSLSAAPATSPRVVSPRYDNLEDEESRTVKGCTTEMVAVSQEDEGYTIGYGA